MSVATDPQMRRVFWLLDRLRVANRSERGAIVQQAIDEDPSPSPLGLSVEGAGVLIRRLEDALYSDPKLLIERGRLLAARRKHDLGVMLASQPVDADDRVA
jgi:hypothetical protein